MPLAKRDGDSHPCSASLMKIAVFDTHPFDREFFDRGNSANLHELVFFEERLHPITAALAHGFTAVCAFVNDQLNRATLQKLHDGGTRLIALRCAGFNNVDLPAARELGLQVVRVPEYSPYAVAEHALALILTLNRKTHRAFSRVREGNFSLTGLVGFDLHGKTAGILGTGKIGSIFARIMHGLGCKLLAYDLRPNTELQKEVGLQFASLAEIYRQADILSLHLPLTPESRHMLDSRSIAQMKKGVMIINTSRGALIDTPALVEGLKTGQIGSAGLDVYEEEAGIFFEDLSGRVLQDDVLARLLTFPNVLITSHQAFLTREALERIAQTTLESVSAFERGEPLQYLVSA